MGINENGLITAIYMRVSTSDQEVKAQMHAISTYLAYKGFARCQNYVDHGLSGKDTNRPAFKCLLDDVKQGKVKRVIVYKLDRLSRSMNDLLDTVGTYKAHGAMFHSISELIDLETPQGELLFHMMGAFAHFERQLISERTRNAMACLRAQGKRAHRGNSKKIMEVKQLVVEQLKTAKSYRNIAHLAGISVNSVQRIKKEAGL